jgi:hypothetical protein
MKMNRFFENITPHMLQEIDKIIDASCSVYRIKPADIKSRARLKPIPDATATASILIEKYFDINESALAKLLNRDRTSIYVYRKKYENRAFDRPFAENLMKAQLIVETGSVDAYKHNMSLQKRLMALRVLIADMTKKKEEVEKQIKELSNVRLD